MRVVAGTAPEPAATRTRARAFGELLGVADHSKCARRLGDVDGEDLFERAPGLEIGDRTARVRDARLGAEVTLLAYAVPRRRREPAGIHDVRGRRRGEMRFRGPMATLAADRPRV